MQHNWFSIFQTMGIELKVPPTEQKQQMGFIETVLRAFNIGESCSAYSESVSSEMDWQEGGGILFELSHPE